VLASLRDAIPDKGYQLWFVLNARRPFTDSVEGALKMIRSIETASTLKTTGIVANTHLLHETTCEIVEEGFALARQVSTALHLPIPFLAVQNSIVSPMEKRSLGIPILPLRLTMRRPWEKET